MPSKVLVALLVCIAALLLQQHSRGRLWLATEARAIDAAQIAVETGHCFRVDLGRVWMSADEGPSAARLLEDGVPLAAGNAPHDAIRQLGGGRYSFWLRHLYFSSSDGSDPRTNGRRYEIRWPWPVAAWIRWALDVLAWAAGAFLVAFVVRSSRWFHSWVERLAPRIERAGLAFRTRDARWQWWSCCAVVGLALPVRVVGLCLVQMDPVGHISGSLVMGVPFSDAQCWDSLGESIAQGHGLPGGWSARRPFMAFAIGALYAWTGVAPFAVVVGHIVIGSLTAGLVCRIGQRVLHPAVGLLGGVAFAFDALSIEFTYYTATETLGTFLFVLALDLLLTAVQESRPGASWWAGVCFASSNLTRTLTLLAAPFWVWFCLCRARSPASSLRQRFVLAALFSLGCGLPLGTWIVRQKVVHDITSVSDNTASALYAAASPKYGSWSSEVDREAQQAGVPDDIKSRYDWFMRRFAEELSAQPLFYLRNAAGSVWAACVVQAEPAPVVRSLLVLLLLGTWLAGLPRFRRAPSALAIWSAALALVLAGLLLHGKVVAPALGLLGLGAAVWRGERRAALLLAATFAAVLAAMGMFALGDEVRLLLMIGWMVPLAQAYGLLCVCGLVVHRLHGTRWQPPAAPAPGRSHAPAWQRWIVRGIVALWIATSVLLAYRNYVAPCPPAPPLSSPSLATARDAVARVAQRLPDAIRPEELERTEPWFHAASSAAELQADHGRLVVAHVRLERHRYAIPGDLEVEHWSRMFEVRSYERSYAAASCRLATGGQWGATVVSARPWPEPAESDLLVVGRADVDLTSTYESSLLEVLAWAPLGRDGQADLSRLQVTTVPAHAEYVRSLVR